VALKDLLRVAVVLNLKGKSKAEASTTEQQAG
jgi:hypothetical protein